MLPTVQERLAEVVEQVLKPLLQRDESDIELVAIDDDVVTVRLHGKAALGAGAPVLQSELIEPTIRKAARQPVTVQMLRAIPTPASKE